MRPRTPRSTARAALAAALVAVLCGCSGSGDPSADLEAGTAGGDGGEPGAGAANGAGAVNSAGAANGDDARTALSRRIFDPAVTGFVVHVFHETGAEPYVGRLGLTTDDTWDVTARSYRDLFAAHRGRTLTVPSRLEQMTGFADRGIASWSLGELVALGESLAPPLVAGDEVSVSVVFVNGIFDGRETVLGIHPANARYAFVFKDVVESAGGDALTQRYVEQATVVHEIGHVVGLVGNGVPMVNAHEDADHPHHTTNGDGVMYWAVETRGGALAFLTDVITGARLSLFGPESLLDAQNFMPDG